MCTDTQSEKFIQVHSIWINFWSIPQGGSRGESFKSKLWVGNSGAFHKEAQEERVSRVNYGLVIKTSLYKIRGKKKLT